MKLRALEMTNVRRFLEPVRIDGFADGVNVLCEPNESGKSTTFDALHAVFFAAHGSRARAVTSLRPYASGAPEVAVEIETGTGRFRIEKRWLSAPRARVTDLGSGRVIAQADEAEAWIDGVVRGGVGGPAGLLWVRQGAGAFDASGREADAEAAARRDLLSSVAGEVEALTGGRRMDVALRRVGEELAVLVTTTGRPKSGGPLREAMDAADALAAEEARLDAEVKSLHARLERRRRAEVELAALADPDEEAARRTRLAQAEAAMRAAEAHGAALARARLERDVAARTLAEAERERDAFAAGLAAEAAARAAARDAATAAGAATAALDAARTAEAEAARGEAAADAALARARSALDAARSAAAARDAREALEAETGRLARAEEHRTRAERAEAEAATVAIGPKDVDAIERAERDRSALALRREAEAMRLGVALAPGAAGRLRIDGVPVEADGSYPLGPRAEIAVAGVGLLTLVQPAAEADGDDTATRLAAAETRLAGLLAPHGLATPAEARQRLEARRAAEARARAARETLTALAPEGLEALRTRVARLEQAATPADAGAAPDPEAAEAAVAAAEAEARTARGRREEARAALVLCETQAATRVAEAEAAASRAARAADALGPEADRATRAEALAAAAAGAAQALAAAAAALQPLEADPPDPEAASAALARARSAVEQAADARRRLDTELARLRGEIGVQAEEAIEERHAETAGRLFAARDRQASLEAEVALLARLRDALEAARRSARDRYFEPVRRELAPLLAMVYGPAEVEFDDATLLPARLTRAALAEGIESLSGGTREQIAVLTRLAFARLLARDGRPTPVILDDALVFTDDDRIERMFDVLHRQASDVQIVVLTCRQRVFRGLGGNVLGFCERPRPAAAE